MRYIGNVISTSDKYKFNRFINVSRNIADVDELLPTLVVGIPKAEEVLGKKLDYVDRHVNSTLSWTFATTEKRSENEKDVEKFKKTIIKNLKNTIKYDYFNILLTNKKRLRSFMRFLLNDIEKTFYFTQKTLYISYENRVIGISLDDCEYVGYKKTYVYNIIKKHFKNVTTEGKFMDDSEKTFFENDNILIAAMFNYANS